MDRATAQARLAARKLIRGRILSPAVRDRLRATLLAAGHTVADIEAMFRARVDATIAVYLALDYHRYPRVEDGRLVIRGRDAATHQAAVEPFNHGTPDRPSVAAQIYTYISERMYQR